MRRIRVRITAVLLALTLLLAGALSSNVIARLHRHDCTGEHCAVCHTIAGAAGELSASATVSATVCLLLVAAGSYVARAYTERTAYGTGTAVPRPRAFVCTTQTPVSLKVVLLI